jgi:hypothetical protein
MVAHACNPSTQEAEAGESRVPGQPGLLCKSLSQKTKTKQPNKKPESFCLDTVERGKT